MNLQTHRRIFITRSPTHAHTTSNYIFVRENRCSRCDLISLSRRLDSGSCDVSRLFAYYIINNKQENEVKLRARKWAGNIQRLPATAGSGDVPLSLVTLCKYLLVLKWQQAGRKTSGKHRAVHHTSTASKKKRPHDGAAGIFRRKMRTDPLYRYGEREISEIDASGDSLSILLCALCAAGAPDPIHVRHGERRRRESKPKRQPTICMEIFRDKVNRLIAFYAFYCRRFPDPERFISRYAIRQRRPPPTTTLRQITRTADDEILMKNLGMIVISNPISFN